MARPALPANYFPPLPDLDGFAECELNCLDERSKTVLRLRSGLADGREYTQAEVGEVLGISGNRVHQLERAARRKISRVRESQRRLRAPAIVATEAGDRRDGGGS
jgi:RNA polymerase sporulation-specific sigma factor